MMNKINVNSNDVNDVNNSFVCVCVCMQFACVYVFVIIYTDNYDNVIFFVMYIIINADHGNIGECMSLFI